MKNLKTLFLSVTVVAALANCATSDKSRITDAATSPLNDLNLVHGTIPAILKEAQKHPYTIPVDKSCEALLADVRALDEVLGADLDTPVSAAKPGLIERGGTAAGDAAIGALKGAAEGAVPFRGWVRKLSGAERYSRDVAAAIAAGTVRRAYFKGMRVASNCAPAAVAAATAGSPVNASANTSAR